MDPNCNIKDFSRDAITWQNSSLYTSIQSLDSKLSKVCLKSSKCIGVLNSTDSFVMILKVFMLSIHVPWDLKPACSLRTIGFRTFDIRSWTMIWLILLIVFSSVECGDKFSVKIPDSHTSLNVGCSNFFITSTSAFNISVSMLALPSALLLFNCFMADLITLEVNVDSRKLLVLTDSIGLWATATCGLLSSSSKYVPFIVPNRFKISCKFLNIES